MFTIRKIVYYKISFLGLWAVLLPVPTLPGPVYYPFHHVPGCAWHFERRLGDGKAGQHYFLLYSFQTHPPDLDQLPSAPQNVVLSGGKKRTVKGLEKIKKIVKGRCYKNINVYDVYRDSWLKTTCGLRHAPLSDVFAPWHPSAFRTGLLPVFVAPLPVWVGLKVGLFYLGALGGTRRLE